MKDKYSFSFTAMTLRYYDFLRLVESIPDDAVRPISAKLLDHEGILKKGNERTSKREMHELIKRYNGLSKDEEKVMRRGSVDSRKKITFVAACKTYSFLLDFVIEVVREKVLVFDYQLGEGDFRSFINRKRELHPELDSFADSTLKKARQSTFKILEEAKIINDVRTKVIQPQWLENDVKEAVVNDNPELLKVFMLSETDIMMLSQKLNAE